VIFEVELGTRDSGQAATEHEPNVLVEPAKDVELSPPIEIPLAPARVELEFKTIGPLAARRLVLFNEMSL
jgi:hypothetical protein